jgi:hypothetical protein
MTISASARILMEGIVDYAGTFPPAGLSLAAAMGNYARDRAGRDAWLLGRLVVPASGLRELDQIAQDRENPLPLTIVLGPQRGSLDEALGFIASSPAAGRVLSIEFPPLKPDEIRALKDAAPAPIELFFELPLDADLDKRIDAVADARAMAKVRTGGLMAGAIPGAEGLVHFMTACNDAGLAFKATAGLHHAMRGSYALTYEPGSPTATMHGFLNTAVAAALVHLGDGPAANDALAESSTDAFQFRDDGLDFKGRLIPNAKLTEARQFFRSFGSCAFREPADELAALGFI